MVGVGVVVIAPGGDVVVAVVVTPPTRGGKARDMKTDSLNDGHESRNFIVVSDSLPFKL